MSIKQADGTETHIGQVLSYTTSYNSSMDITSSYAIVWNADKNNTEQVYVWNDFDSRTNDSYTIDATPEVVTAYEAKKQADSRAYYAEQEAREIATVRKDKTVTVVRGRKVPIGTRGQVFWIGNNGYGESVGIITADGSKHFTAIGNVEVTPLPEGEVTAIQAASDASKAAWRASNPRPAFVPNKSYASYGRRRYAY